MMYDNRQIIGRMVGLVVRYEQPGYNLKFIIENILVFYKDIFIWDK